MTSTPPVLEPTKLSYDSFIQLLPFFFAEVKEDFIQLGKSLEIKDTESIRLLAHKIKGSSASYGANTISDKARLLQSLIDTESTDSLQGAVTVLGESIEEAYVYSRDKFHIS